MKKNLKKHIIPTILAYSKQEFLYTYNKIQENGFPFFQIDVVSRAFTGFPPTWATPKRVKNLRITIPFEVDYMTYQPKKHIVAWKNAGARRFYVHIEAVGDPRLLMEYIKKTGMEAGISLNPETSIKTLSLLLPILRAILILGVRPGKGGQPLQPRILKKIRGLRTMGYRGLIEIDGGVTIKNAASLLRAGANVLASGSMAYSEVT